MNEDRKENLKMFFSTVSLVPMLLCFIYTLETLEIAQQYCYDIPTVFSGLLCFCVVLVCFDGSLVFVCVLCLLRVVWSVIFLIDTTF